MTSDELKKLQQRIKFDAPSMAVCLGVPYHTYRNYLYGENTIPGSVARAAEMLEKFEKQLDHERVARIDETIKKQFPNGIVSDVEVWE